MRNTPSSSALPAIAVQGPNGLNANNDQSRIADTAIATPPRMLTAVAAAAADADTAALLATRINNALCRVDELLAVISEFAANAAAPFLRPQATPARRPVDPSSKKTIGSDEMPDWPGHVWSNEDGTYNLSVNSNNRRIGKIKTVLSKQSCIRKLSYRLCAVDKQSIPGLDDVCAGLRQNHGLKTFVVRHSLLDLPVADPDEFFEFCNAVHGHLTLEELELPSGQLVHGAALNKELSHPRSKLTSLSIMLPESQQQLDAFAAALGNNRRLATLDLALSAESAMSHDCLAKALANHPTLTNLQLNFIGATSDCRALFRALAASRSLRSVTLRNCDDRQARGLQEFLSLAQNVQRIRLWDPRLSPENGALVAAGFDRNLSMISAEFSPLSHQGKVDYVDAARQIALAIQRALLRNRGLGPELQKKIALVGDALAARMALDKPCDYDGPVLPAEVGALIAESVAVHLSPDDAQRIYQALWPE